MTFAKTGQKFSVYPNNKTNKFAIWFHVKDYYSKEGKKLSQRSYKSFETREQAIQWACDICEQLPKKHVGKNQKIKDVVEYSVSSKRKDIIKICREAMLRLQAYPFITSHHVLVEAGLETLDKKYNDDVFRACSSLRLYNEKHNIRTKDFGKPSPAFSEGGRRPAQLFRVLGQM